MAFWESTFWQSDFWVADFWEGQSTTSRTKGGDAGAATRHSETKRLRKETESLIAAKKAELDRLFNDVVETSKDITKKVEEAPPPGLFPVIPLKPLFTLSPFSMEQQRQERKKADAARKRIAMVSAAKKAREIKAHATAVAKHEAATKAYEDEYAKLMAKIMGINYWEFK